MNPLSGVTNIGFPLGYTCPPYNEDSPTIRHILIIRNIVSSQVRIMVAARSASRPFSSAKPAVGRRSMHVKDLVGQNQGVSNMEIARTDLKGFERVTRKYGVDYAIRKDPSQDPTRYIVFFKARDAYYWVIIAAENIGNSATRERCLTTAQQELTEEEYDKLLHLLNASREVDAAIHAEQSQG